jgi:hypothetical protein
MARQCSLQAFWYTRRHVPQRLSRQAHQVLDRLDAVRPELLLLRLELGVCQPLGQRTPSAAAAAAAAAPVPRP